MASSGARTPTKATIVRRDSSNWQLPLKGIGQPEGAWGDGVDDPPSGPAGGSFGYGGSGSRDS